MKFIKAQDTEGYYQRLVSDCGKFEMGVYPVMFGYRVRCGYIGSMMYEIDWCGGDDQAQVELLYSIAKNILENKGNFDGVPTMSRVKPFFNDKEFVDLIQSLVTQPLEIQKLKPLNLDRIELFKKL